MPETQRRPADAAKNDYEVCGDGEQANGNPSVPVIRPVGMLLGIAGQVAVKGLAVNASASRADWYHCEK